MQVTRGKSTGYRLPLLMVSMYSRLITPIFCCNALPCILNTGCTPKTEAACRPLMFKCSGHTRSVKIPSKLNNKGTRGYYCWWLLCILGWLLHANAVRGYMVFSPQVLCCYHIFFPQIVCLKSLMHI